MSDRFTLAEYIPYLKQPKVVKRGLYFSLVVGSILVCINQGDHIVQGNWENVSVLKIVLTYMVPYIVSCLSSV